MENLTEGAKAPKATETNGLKPLDLTKANHPIGECGKIILSSSYESSSKICEKLGLKEGQVFETVVSQIQSEAQFTNKDASGKEVTRLHYLVEFQTDDFFFKKWVPENSALHWAVINLQCMNFIVKNYKSDVFTGLTLSLALTDTQKESIAAHNRVIN